MTKTNIDAPEFVARLKAHDTSAFDYLYDYYSPALYGIVLLIVKKEELAQEVVQDVFIKVWKNIGQYTASRGRLFTWLFRLARNLAIDKMRSKEIKREIKTDAVSDMVHIIDNKHHEQQQTDSIGIEKLLSSLKEEQYQTINLLSSIEQMKP